jgi:hypothetical protein
MLSADKRLQLAKQLEDFNTAPAALRVIVESELTSWGPDFDKTIKDLELDETDYLKIAHTMLTQGLPVAVKLIEQTPAVKEEVKRIEGVVEAWVVSHPEYLANGRNSQALKDFMEEQELKYTKGNLEKAWESLMLAGKLEEAPVTPSRPYFVGQADPSKVAAGDPVIRKSPAAMSAAEFATAIATSKKFRDKINAGPSTVAPAAPGLTEAERDLHAENVKKQTKKQELQRQINQMSSRAYDQWVKEPGNKALVDSLHATA